MSLRGKRDMGVHVAFEGFCFGPALKGNERGRRRFGGRRFSKTRPNGTASNAAKAERGALTTWVHRQRKQMHESNGRGSKPKN